MTTPTTPTPKLPANLTSAQLLSFKPYTSWLSSLTSSLSQQQQPSHPFHSDPYILRSLTVSHADFFGQRIGFLNVTASLTNSAGESLPGMAFLRGGSVAVLVILQEEEGGEGEEWALLTVQPRVPAGALEFVELPAGMVDGDTFTGAAAKEIEEECGIVIKAEGLVDLTKLALGALVREMEGERLEAAVYPSPGGAPHTPIWEEYG